MKQTGKKYKFLILFHYDLKAWAWINKSTRKYSKCVFCRKKARDRHLAALAFSANNANGRNSNASLYDAEDKEKKAELLFVQLEANRKRVESIYEEKIFPQAIAVIHKLQVDFIIFRKLKRQRLIGWLLLKR